MLNQMLWFELFLCRLLCANWGVDWRNWVPVASPSLEQITIGQHIITNFMALFFLVSTKAGYLLIMHPWSQILANYLLKSLINYFNYLKYVSYRISICICKHICAVHAKQREEIWKAAAENQSQEREAFNLIPRLGTKDGADKTTWSYL